MNKLTLVVVVLFAIFSQFALAEEFALDKAPPAKDACDKAVYNYAITQQHKDYPKSQWKKSMPGDPDTAFVEAKAKGFELWEISYTVDEECFEGYNVLVRRSGDGKSCAVIKQDGDSSRDCG